MTTIAIVGAGPGTGAAVARRFGREGHAVALISRNKGKLDSLADELRADGITARGFPADVRDPAGLTQALEEAAAALGPIAMLQYSPIPQAEFLKPVLETTIEDLVAAVEFSIYGPVTAVGAVLGGMVERGAGTIVAVNGGTAVRPRADYAGTSVAFAGESAYLHALHDAVADDGVHVAQLVVPGAIDPDDRASSPTAIADRVWAIHTDRGDFRTFLTPMTDGRR